jgi:hypothetical protein
MFNALLTLNSDTRISVSTNFLQKLQNCISQINHTEQNLSPETLKDTFLKSHSRQQRQSFHIPT